MKAERPRKTYLSLTRRSLIPIIIFSKARSLRSRHLCMAITIFDFGFSLSRTEIANKATGAYSSLRRRVRGDLPRCGLRRGCGDLGVNSW